MSVRRLKDAKGVACGCEVSTDRRGQDYMSQTCQEHEAEYIARHLAAVESCSHVNRDLTGG